jgi:hypothetical protein
MSALRDYIEKKVFDDSGYAIAWALLRIADRLEELDEGSLSYLETIANKNPSPDSQ